MEEKDTKILKQERELELLRERNAELERRLSAPGGKQRSGRVSAETPPQSSSSEDEDDVNDHLYAVPKFVIRPKQQEQENEDPDRLAMPPSSAADDAFLATPAAPSLRRRAFRQADSADSGRETDASSTVSAEAIADRAGSSPESVRSEDLVRADVPESVYLAENAVNDVLEVSEREVESTYSRLERETSILPKTTKTRDVQFERFLNDAGMDTKSILSPSWMLTNHRQFKKPSDVKNRSRMRSVVGDLTVLEESEVNSEGEVTRVNYWTEQNL